MTSHRQILLENGSASHAILKALGFEQTASVLAGHDSKSCWLRNADGHRATVAVVHMNLIDFEHGDGRPYTNEETCAALAAGLKEIAR